MKILITGGAGCLGTNLVEHFLQNYEQVEILVVDNFATSKSEPITKLPVQFCEGSIYDYSLMSQVFKDFEPRVVINSAASYKDPANWLEDSKTNIEGSILLAKLCAGFGVERLINFQTVLCYGEPNIIPIPITHPVAPKSSYGISKTAGEQYLLSSELNAVSLRLANICAPRLSIGPIPTFYTRLKEGKDCYCSDTSRDFLDISDFFDIIDTLLSEIHWSVRGTFNIASGQGKSIYQVYREIESALNLPPRAVVPIVPPNADDIKDIVLDISETIKILGWQPKVSFKSMISKQIQWYEENAVDSIYSHLAPIEKKKN